MTPSATRLSSAVVWSAIFIDAVSVGIVLPVLPDLLAELPGAPDRFGCRAQGLLTGAPFAAAGLMTIALLIKLRPIPRYRQP